MTVNDTPNIPADFSRWESYSQPGTGEVRLAVDTHGRRWIKTPGTDSYGPAPRDHMSDNAWAEHQAGSRKAFEESEQRMTTPTTTGTAQPSEATGIRSLVARLDQIAGVHTSLGSDEGFLGSLNRMEVGSGDTAKVAEAQEKSRQAAAAWQTAAEAVRRNNMPLQEAYATSPDAANKQANTNE